MMNTSIVGEVNDRMNAFETIGSVFGANAASVEYMRNFESRANKHEPEITRIVESFYESIDNVSKGSVFINKDKTVITGSLEGQLESNYFYGNKFFLNFEVINAFVTENSLGNEGYSFFTVKMGIYSEEQRVAIQGVGIN